MPEETEEEIMRVILIEVTVGNESYKQIAVAETDTQASSSSHSCGSTRI